MRIWLAGRQAMAAMDAVMKSWAGALGLSVSELMVLMLLDERRRRCCADLATFSGRTRQQVQATLQGLEARGLVAPATRSSGGKIQAWELTTPGRARFELIAKRMALWAELIGAPSEVEALAVQLEQMVEALVNRPWGGHGWRAGLAVPEALRLDPGWDGAALREAVAMEAEAVRLASGQLEPEAKATRAAPAGARGPDDVPKTDKSDVAAQRQAAEGQAISDAWDAMWR